MDMIQTLVEFGLDNKFLLGLGLGVSYSLLKLLIQNFRSTDSKVAQDPSDNAVRILHLFTYLINQRFIQLVHSVY